MFFFFLFGFSFSFLVVRVKSLIWDQQKTFLEPLVLLFWILGTLGFSMDCNLPLSTGWFPIYVRTLSTLLSFSDRTESSKAVSLVDASCFVTSKTEKFTKYLLIIFQEQEKKVATELIELRNNITLAFFMMNAMFVVIMFTLQLQV